VERPMAALYPADCVERVARGNTVHVTFHGCSGPFGRLHLEGSVDTTFSRGTDGLLHATIEGADDLTANGHPFAYHATAVIEAEGELRKIQITATASATTPRGRAMSRQSSLDVLLDPATHCVDIAGTSSGTTGRRSISAVIDGLKVCADQCPTAGHVERTVSTRRGTRTMTVDFDGTDQARVVGFRGQTLAVQLACGDREADAGE
jgi:hypothetical protein